MTINLIKHAIRRVILNNVFKVLLIFLYVYIFFIVLMFNLSTANDDLSNSFYSDKAKGWFWYHEELLEDKSKALDTKEDNGDELAINLLQNPSLLTENLSVKELRLLLPKSLELATEEPSIANVYTYYALQKKALQKSNDFANKAQEVLLLHPDLAEFSKLSSFPAARDIEFKDKQKEQDELIRELAANSTLVFFYKGACPYCKLAVLEINMLKKYGFSIIGISLDNQVIEEIDFEKHYFMSQEDLKIKVTRVPTIVVYNNSIDAPKSGANKVANKVADKEENDIKVITVCSGLVKLSDMLNRLADISRMWNSNGNNSKYEYH